jgi:phage-related protein
MNEATKRFARIHAPWLLQKYYAAQKYLDSIRKYLRFAPNERKKELRKELNKIENELREIEEDIQDRIDKQFKEKEIQDMRVKYGEKAAKITEDIKEIQSRGKKQRERRGEEKKRRKEEE